ncbi:hypothetical protein [Novosphingobium sp. 17-62-19]|uniref:hypothetical protein n=1 Tax=Novosphingobium sp. 17-62-19 TaxID=1970406 RepID=UPI0025D26102|nr:hypothetical protein [Novosphingobium sp. 17-62-19]HQS96360.1 hypothetical protein [Novosphingobium sp.]
MTEQDASASRAQIDENGMPNERALADLGVNSIGSAALVTQTLCRGYFGELPLPGLIEALNDLSIAVKAGDLAEQRALLANQSVSLNAIFVEMVRRSAANMGENMAATDHYMRLALKAQSQCRATVEALDRLVNGHQQLVKHVHVNEGGQAIVADQFHHHTGGAENGQLAEQPHAKGARGSSLPRPDAIRQVLPSASDQGTQEVPNARRQGKRRTTRQL